MPTPTTRTRFEKNWTGFAKGKKSIGQFLQTDEKIKIQITVNQLIAIFARRFPKLLAESPRKIVRVVEPDRIGNFGDVQLGGFEHFHRPVKAYFPDERIGRLTREGIQFAVELRWAEEDGPAELFGAEARVV